MILEPLKKRGTISQKKGRKEDSIRKGGRGLATFADVDPFSEGEVL